MKVGYLGGTRGYQSAVYRPGSGWTGSGQHWRFRRQPCVLGKDRFVCVAPLTVAYRRRPGLRTKTLIISSIAVIAILLAMVLTGTGRL